MAQIKASATVVDITDKLLGGKAGIKKPFRMAAKDGVGEIFIYDDIGSGFFSDGVTAKSFADDLKALGKVRTLNIFINSPGGSVFDGVAIFNILKRQKARKIVHIDGIAASVASVIAMAGDEINIAANGFVMIHKPWVFTGGTDSDLHKTAEQLTKIGDSILNTYAERTGTPENVIADMMAAETWMNAEEAVELGFADQITDEVAIAAKFDLGQFQNVPEDVAAKLDLAKNPPKVEFAHGGLVAKDAEDFKDQQARLKDVVCGIDLSSKDDIMTVVVVKHPEEAEKVVTVDEEPFEEIHEIISASGEVISRSRKLIPAVSIADLDIDTEPEPRTPHVAITKIRQRIKKRGIARKDGDETAATA